jgi:hypothetical protein
VNPITPEFRETGVGSRREPLRFNPHSSFAGDLDQTTTQWYIHFMPKDKREMAESIPFEF